MLSEETGKEIVEKLDILVKLQAQAMVKSFDNQKEKIIFLSGAGLTPKLISELLNTSSNTVSVTLSQLKKAAKKK